MDNGMQIQEEILTVERWAYTGDDFERGDSLPKALHSLENSEHVQRGDKYVDIVTESKTNNLANGEHGDLISASENVPIDVDVVVAMKSLIIVGDEEHPCFNGEMDPEVLGDRPRIDREDHKCHHQLVNGSENSSFFPKLDNGIEAQNVDGIDADIKFDSILESDMITGKKFREDEMNTKCEYIEAGVLKITVEDGSSFRVNNTADIPKITVEADIKFDSQRESVIESDIPKITVEDGSSFRVNNTTGCISDPLDSNSENYAEGKPEGFLCTTDLEHTGGLAELQERPVGENVHTHSGESEEVTSIDLKQNLVSEIDSLSSDECNEKSTSRKNEADMNINAASCQATNPSCVEIPSPSPNGVSDLALQNRREPGELELGFCVGEVGKSGDEMKIKNDIVDEIESTSLIFKPQAGDDMQSNASVVGVISENAGVLNGGENSSSNTAVINSTPYSGNPLLENNNSVVEDSVAAALVNGNASNSVKFDDRSEKAQGIGTSIEKAGDACNTIETEGMGKSIERTGDARKAVETKENMQLNSQHTSSVGCPAGLGSSTSLLEPAPRAVQQTRTNGSISQQGGQDLVETASVVEGEEIDETREKLQTIRVKFLRLARRLGQTPHNVVVAQVLYRLGLAEQLRGRNGGRVGAFSFDRASGLAEQLENAGEPLDFSCTVMVIGKTGVGKSSTINSIFDEVKFDTNAFHLGTKNVQDVLGTVQRIKLRIIDTPGLFSSWSDQRKNEKMLQSVKRFIKKNPPDIVWYLDRLDMQSREFGDMPLLHTITDVFGPSIWLNAVVVLTHAASAPPDGANGMASSYDMFITQRSHVVQQAIRQVAGDMRLMNPVAFVENHSACRTDRSGQRVLPNGQVWKPHLLLFSFASKILAEANTLLKLQDTPPGKAYTARSRIPPLPFLLSSLIQSRPQLQLPGPFFGEGDTVGDDDMDEESDSEDDSEYEELPPFKCLTKAEIHMLTKSQRSAYFDELEYREKLFTRRQIKEEKKRRKMMAKMADISKEFQGGDGEGVEEDNGGVASVPVPMPDLALPYSFDSENPAHRYRHLDSSHQWLVRPVLETHGWDHDVGYEGMNVEKTFVFKGKLPVSFSGQVSKDKKDANVQMEIASSVKHGEGKGTTLCFDMQTAGKDVLCTVRSDTKFVNCKRNKATAGLSATLLGESVSAGVKLEDKLMISKRLHLAITGGAMTNRGDVAYGGSFEATLRDKDYPSGQSSSTMGLSVMDWHDDLAIGCNMQSLIPIGRFTCMLCKANLNNKGAGQVAIKFTSSEHLQIALLIGFIPLIGKLIGHQHRN